MSNYLKSAKMLLVAAAVLVVSANGAETTKTEHTETMKTETTKGLTFSGSAEGGYAYSWTAPAAGANAKDSEFLLDNANVRMGLDVSDRTSFVIDSAFAIRPPASVNDGNPAGNGVGNAFNSLKYYAKSGILVGTAGNLAYAINEAYISNKWSDCFTMWVGQFKTPFGMEAKLSRFDMPTYYYSAAYNNGQAYNMFYDLGLKFDFAGESWGHLELAVTDGKSVLTGASVAAGGIGNTNYFSPAITARYSYDYKNGDMSLTPVLSAYLGEWAGGPQDVGLSAGLAYKMGVITLNAEWLMTAMSTNPTSGGTQDSKIWSIYLEPGFDLGMLQVNVKGEYVNNTANSDWNVGASIGHTYMEKYRVRLAYQHTNFSSNVGTPANDLRLLFGTKF